MKIQTFLQHHHERISMEFLGFLMNGKINSRHLIKIISRPFDFLRYFEIALMLKKYIHLMKCLTHRPWHSTDKKKTEIKSNIKRIVLFLIHPIALTAIKIIDKAINLLLNKSFVTSTSRKFSQHFYYAQPRKRKESGTIKMTQTESRIMSRTFWSDG